MNFESQKIKEIEFCLPDKLSGISKKEAIKQITEQIKDNKEVGFAGYIEKSYLEDFLIHSIFGDSKEVSLPDISKHIPDIKSCIIETISKCNELISVPPLYTFVFPTQNSFIQEQMGGVSGFAPYQKTIHLYINSEVKGWFNELSKTLAHEIAHAISHSLFSRETILDNIIFEGIAEHFREKTVGDERAPWTKAISEREAEELLEKLEKEELLSDKEDDKLYNNLFFGNDEFPQWAGYTIGYLIVGKVLASGSFEIADLMKKPPMEIFELYKGNKA